MQDDFEKRVQQKMEELNLTPSVPVWEKIELQIKPRRKRRRVFIWFFFAALLMAGGWWLLPMQEQAKLQTPESGQANPVGQMTGAATVEKPARSTQKSGTEESRVSTAATETVMKKRSTVQQQKIEKHSDVQPLEREKQSGSLALLRKKDEHSNFSRRAAPLKAMPALNNRVLETKDQQPSPIAGSPFAKEGKENVVLKQQSSTTSSPVTNTTDSSKAAQPGGREIKTTPPADSSHRKAKVASAGKKWKKQAWLQGGWSQYSASLITGYQAAYDATSYNSNSPVNSLLDRKPAVYTKGFSYTAGVGFAKTINERFTLTAGLQYAYYSVNSQVGYYKRIDTVIAYSGRQVAVGGYYDKYLSTDFTTQYHLLELPLGVAWRMFEKLPLQFSLGASYGRLLQTNALTSIASSNFYYYNKENNNTGFLNLFAGLQYNFVNKQSITFSAGPQVQYSLTPLQKQASANQPHLFSAGMKTTVSF